MATSEGYTHSEYLVDAAWVEAHKNDANLVLIDCDVEAGYNRGHIPGAYNLLLSTSEFNEVRLAEIVGKTQEMVIYSSRDYDDGYRSPFTRAARAVTWGFEKVYIFRDGLDGWKAAGYPVETGK